MTTDEFIAMLPEVRSDHAIDFLGENNAIRLIKGGRRFNIVSAMANHLKRPEAPIIDPYHAQQVIRLRNSSMDEIMAAAENPSHPLRRRLLNALRTI